MSAVSARFCRGSVSVDVHHVFLYVGHMTNRENDVTLTWVRKPHLGTPTYHANTERAGAKWSVTIDKPYSNRWVLRIWRDGYLVRYIEEATLRDGKASAVRVISGACPECHRLGDHKLDCSNWRWS